jgi:hypothetical protein
MSREAAWHALTVEESFSKLVRVTGDYQALKHQQATNACAKRLEEE